MFRVFLFGFLGLLLFSAPALANKGEGDTVNLRRLLPGQVLESRDAVLYRSVFSFQRAGKFDKADELLQKIANPVLKGHVLAERYLHPKSGRASYKALAGWMVKYGDHPQASKIYKLAASRKPKEAGGLTEVYNPFIPEPFQNERARLRRAGQKKASGGRNFRYHCKKNTAVRHLARRKNARAVALIHDKNWRNKPGPSGFYVCRSLIVRNLFIRGLDQEAIFVATLPDTKKITGDPAELYWWSGLSAFRLKDYDTAVLAFTRSALFHPPGEYDRLSSASSYWAARAWLHKGKPKNAVNMWRASYDRFPFGFYGQLSAESLGFGVPYNWRDPSVKSGLQKSHMARFPAGKRVVALAQIGQIGLAKREMRNFVGDLSADAKASYMVLAREMGMTDMAYAMAHALERDHGESFHASLYPLPIWKPKDGFKLDPMLIFAFVRQESGFNPEARSSANARGLMQLMPATAQFIQRRKVTTSELYTPSFNLSLGQKYLIYLMQNKDLGDNMLAVVASYNAGPGNIGRWMSDKYPSDIYRTDPLVYIESIPWMETRNFVKKIMTNLWIYREKYNVKPQTRRDLAEGRWPVYRPSSGKKAAILKQ